MINSKMNVNMQNISEYIEKIVGAEVQIYPLDKAKKQALPILITNAYQLLHCLCFSHVYIP